VSAQGSFWVYAYFVSFILVCDLVLLNLIIAIIIASLDKITARRARSVCVGVCVYVRARVCPRVSVRVPFVCLRAPLRPEVSRGRELDQRVQRAIEQERRDAKTASHKALRATCTRAPARLHRPLLRVDPGTGAAGAARMAGGSTIARRCGSWGSRSTSVRG
jgi:hypothetical protein